LLSRYMNTLNTHQQLYQVGQRIPPSKSHREY
jgi:hypothetical protein